MTHLKRSVASGSPPRLKLSVAPLEGERRITQTKGFPIDPSKIPPAPDVVLLIADDTPGAMLFRYTVHGEFGGDTWHPSVEDAREHAIYDYSDALGY